ncbi:family 20 glycosylhydrolase [Streptococcus cameli]
MAILKVFSLDAGRKYFTVDQLKEIIDHVSKEGYSDFHLLLGNDGMRFLLDDMSLSVDGIEYESEAVKEAIKAGNRAYYDDPNGNALTESEMDDLINYAKSKYINIIPAVNSPGHMDAILDAMESLGIENPHFTYNHKKSDRTIDLDNTSAVHFTKAFIGKYVSYFSGKADYFNIGLDEYANDATDAKGWAVLQTTGKYGKFVQYANDLTAIVKAGKLTPIAFNDGVYYNNVDDDAFDKELVISYWTAGWTGYDVAKAKFISDKGHAILNTNDAWYYVIGRENSASGHYHVEQGKSGIKNVPFSQVPGANPDEIPIMGSMVATWADDPSGLFVMETYKNYLTLFSNKNRDYFFID